MEQLGKMARAVLIVERNTGQFWKKINPPQPFLDRRCDFSLQYGRHALYLQFPHVLLFGDDTAVAVRIGTRLARAKLALLVRSGSASWTPDCKCLFNAEFFLHVER